MTPISFTVKDGVTRFHYKFSELREWYSLGIKHGDVGMILWSRKDNLLTYKCFGTIEHPRESIITLSLIHHHMFDGEMPSDEQRLIEPKPFFNSENTKMFILDMSNITPQKDFKSNYIGGIDPYEK